jgi:general secretion pathway protein J
MTARHETERKGERGFTLLELLVAITVLSLISVLLMSGVGFAGHAWQSTGDTVAESSEVFAVQSTLRRLIGQAYPAVLAPLQSNTVAFSGSPDSVEFIAASSPRHDGAWLTRVRLHLESDTAAPRLALDWRRLGADEAKDERAGLLSAMRGLTMAYYGQAAGERNAGWHDSWTGQPSLPDLVRVEVAFAPEDRRSWPTLYVQPMVTMDAACIYDPVSRGCRRD